MTAMVTDRLHGTQLQSRDRGDDIQPDPTFEADRLKREGVVEPADEAIGRSADTNRSSTRSADISASQCTGADVRRGREDSPTQGHIAGEANLSSEPLHRALIVLGRSTA